MLVAGASHFRFCGVFARYFLLFSIGFFRFRGRMLVAGAVLVEYLGSTGGVLGEYWKEYWGNIAAVLETQCRWCSGKLVGCSGELLRLLWGAPGGALESSCGALESSWAGVGELLGVLWGAPGGALRSY